MKAFWNINSRHMLVGPLSFLLLLWFAIGYALKDYFEPRGVPSILRSVAIVTIVLPFAVADILYNVLVGTFLFWELPKELMFTSRLGRWKKRTDDPMKSAYAKYICGLLHLHDPDHC